MTSRVGCVWCVSFRSQPLSGSSFDWDECFVFFGCGLRVKTTFILVCEFLDVHILPLGVVLSLSSSSRLFNWTLLYLD